MTNTNPATILTNAAIYTTGGEMAYEAEYADGRKVRAVVARNGWIRTEYKAGDAWKLSGKPYVVKADRKRNAERIRAAVVEFLGT